MNAKIGNNFVIHKKGWTFKIEFNNHYQETKRAASKLNATLFYAFL